MPASASRVSLWAPVVFYMALIFVGSSMSHPPGIATGVSDKILHIVVYGGLGAVLVRALTGGWAAPVTAAVAVKVVVVAALYGVSDEMHQSFVPERDVEALDVLADAAGAAIASGALWAWGIIRGRDGL